MKSPYELELSKPGAIEQLYVGKPIRKVTYDPYRHRTPEFVTKAQKAADQLYDDTGKVITYLQTAGWATTLKIGQDVGISRERVIKVISGNPRFKRRHGHRTVEYAV